MSDATPHDHLVWPQVLKCHDTSPLRHIPADVLVGSAWEAGCAEHLSLAANVSILELNEKNTHPESQFPTSQSPILKISQSPTWKTVQTISFLSPSRCGHAVRWIHGQTAPQRALEAFRASRQSWIAQRRTAGFYWGCTILHWLVVWNNFYFPIY